MAATMRKTRSGILGEFGDGGLQWSAIGQNRLDRLLELRAFVASLRADRAQELLRDLRAEFDPHRP